MKLEKLKFKSGFTPLFVGGNTAKKILESSRATKQGKIYKGVTIIKSGLGNRRDKNYYPPKALKSAVEKGLFEGLRAFVDHPDSVSEEILPERSVRDVAGIYTNTKFKESAEGKARVTGDLRVFKHQNWLSELVDELIEAGQADKIGISVNGSGKTLPKKMKIAEAGPDPIDVNWLEDFVSLRSADVVTEAGAGGGWSELRESVRGALREKKMALSRKELTLLQEAAAEGDLDAIRKLTSALEAVATDTKKKKKVGDADSKKRKKDDEEDLEESDELDGEEGEDDPDLDDELDDAVEEAKLGTDQEDLDDDDDDLDDDDSEGEDEGEDELEESDDQDDDSEGDLEEAGDDDEGEDNSSKRRKQLSAVNKLKAHLKDTIRHKTREARMPKQMNKGKNGSAVNKRATQHARQKGRGFPSSTGDGIKAKEVNAMAAGYETKLARLLEKNARLSAALRVRTTADRAKRLLRESSIPEKLQPDILPLLVGQTEDEMARRIRYHERLVGTVLEEAGVTGLGYEAIDGQGSRIREGSYGASGGDIDDVFEEVGLPIREAGADDDDELEDDEEEQDE